MIGIISLISGTSYAVLKGNTSDTNEQIIKTGKVELTLTEKYDNINKKITIMSDEDGLLQEDTYDFNIKNTGDSPAKYNLKLVNEVPSSYTGKVLDTKYIKVGLEINGEEYGPMSLEKVKNIIDSDVIYKRELINFKLRIWLDSSKEKEIESLENYKAFLKLKVEAIQRPESMDNGVNTKTFNYTGKVQEYTVPRDGYYYIELGGGAGGDGFSKGAKTSGYVKLNAGEKLYFYVGEQGTAANTNCRTTGYEFNGGGIALPGKSGICGPAGGGATDVRLVGGNWDDTKSLISRIMVAGGAGGGAGEVSQYTTGFGGTLVGVTPLFSTYQSNLGTGGTQSYGGVAPTKDSCAQSTGTAGSFGKGGSGGASSATNVVTGGGAGGGSGYYGGSGASGLCNGTWPGAGGSSYISGYAGVNSVKDSTTITHTNDTLHYSGIYFIGGDMVEGQNSGNGYAKISFVDTKPKRKNTKLNNVRYIKNCVSQDSSNNINTWVEIQAIKDGVNIAKGKTAGIYDANNNLLSSLGNNYSYSYMTDGIIDNVEGSKGYSTATTYTGTQCAIVDLGSIYDLDEVSAWHYARDMRTYYKEKTYVSSDKNSWNEVINETKVGDSSGIRYNAYNEKINGYIQDNLVLWLDAFSNTGATRSISTTTWKDLSGTSNNATLSGPTWYNNYLSFDGTNDYATIPYSQTLAPSEFTIDLTFSKQSIVNNSRSILFVKWYGYTIELNADNTVVFGTRNSTTAYPYLSAGKIDLKKIYNIVATYKDNVESIYVNGVLKATRKNTSSTFAHSNNAVSIGRYQTSNYANANVRQIKFYNRVLTQDEITHNYNYTKQKFDIE